MRRIDLILEHRVFRWHLEANEAAETERVFCHHDMAHFLDVARIGLILNLEEQYGVEKELIYAAALLHDMGKHLQYEKGTPHELASAEIAPDILRDCDFSDAEIADIAEAIRLHRDADSASKKNLIGLLYRADKASRSCFACKAECECNWKGDKKNLQIKY